MSAFLVAVVAVVYALGFAWQPTGNAPRSVLDGAGCAVSDTNVSVDGPQEVVSDEPDGAWSLLAFDADQVLHTSLGGYGAERYVKAQLPWGVRMRLMWDSESGLLAAYGARDDICMLARVVEQRRTSLATQPAL